MPSVVDAPFTVKTVPSENSGMNLIQVENVSGPSLKLLVDWMRKKEIAGLSLRNAKGLAPSDYAVLRDLPTLRTLEIYNGDFTDDCFAQLGGLENLESLDLTVCNLSGASYIELTRFPKLRELWMPSTHQTESDLKIFGMLKNLRSLSFSLGHKFPAENTLKVLAKLSLEKLKGVRVTTPKEIELLASMNSLRELSLNVYGVKANFKPLEKLQNLEILTGEVPLKHLAALPKIKHVKCKLDEETAKLLAGLSALESLEVSEDRSGGSTKKQTGAGSPTADYFAKLSGLAALKSIVLDGFSDNDLATLHTLPALASLKLSSSIGDKGLAHLVGCKALHYLDARYNRAATMKGVKHIAAITQLRTLNVDRWDKKFDDCGLEMLTALPYLEKLDLGDAAVTNQGLKALARIKSLKHFRVSWLELNDVGVEAMSSAPSLEIDDLFINKITNRGLKAVARMNLRQLNLPGKSKAAEIQFLATKQIQSLGIETDAAGLKTVGKMPALTSLRLRGASAAGFKELLILKLESLTLGDEESTLDKGIPPLLAKMKSLRYLRVESRADDAVLEAAAQLPLLVKLELFAAEGVTDTGVKALAGLRSLRQLSLRSSPFDGSGFEAWSETAELSSLELDECRKFGDRGVAALTRLPAMRTLDTSESSISNASLPLLAKSKLEKVKLYRSTRLTYEKTKAFAEEMKNRTPSMSVFEDVKRALPKEKTATWKAEQKLKKGFKPQTKGALSPEVVEQLKRLGAKPGETGGYPAEWPAPLRELASFSFSEKEFENDDETYPCGIFSLRFYKEISAEPNTEYLALENRPMLELGASDHHYVVVPLDTDMPEDPPVYVLDHEHGDDHVDEQKPGRLSWFLSTLKPAK